MDQEVCDHNAKKKGSSKYIAICLVKLGRVRLQRETVFVKQRAENKRSPTFQIEHYEIKSNKVTSLPYREMESVTSVILHM
jgi:hypothetical protein